MTYLRAGMLILALLFCFSNSIAQDTVRKVKLPEFSNTRRGESNLDIRPTSVPSAVTPLPNSSVSVGEEHPSVVVSKTKEHSPRKALLLSILPGAGQVYNGQAWKVPIIYAALGTVGYLVYDNYTQMTMYKEDYLYRITHGGEALIDKYASYPNESIYNMYQAYNKDFQLMIIISAGVYALNLVDAYVFGHLYDFQINDDLSLHVSPQVAPILSPNGNMGLSPSLGLTLRF